MPKTFDRKKLHAYAGRYGSTSGKALAVNVRGRTITGDIKNFGSGEGVTVNLRLPEGYYQGAWSERRQVLGVGIAALALADAAAALYLRFKRRQNLVCPVMFHPPEGFDPLQVNTIDNQGSGHDSRRACHAAISGKCRLFEN